MHPLVCERGHGCWTKCLDIEKTVCVIEWARPVVRVEKHYILVQLSVVTSLKGHDW